MKIMANKLLILTVAYFLWICCNQVVNDNNLNVSNEFSEKWGIDTLGCLGYRKQLSTDSFYVFEKFKNHDYAYFVMVFGKAIENKIANEQTDYIYFIGCSSIPLVKFNNKTKDSLSTRIVKKRINSEATYLLVKVDNYNIIKDISIIVP